MTDLKRPILDAVLSVCGGCAEFPGSLVQSWVEEERQQVRDRVGDEEHQGAPEHIGLDDRIVLGLDGAQGVAPDALPGEDHLDYGRTSEQRAKAVRPQGAHWGGDVAQDVCPDPGLAHATDPEPSHIWLVVLLQGDGSNLTGVPADHRQAQRDGRHHHAPDILRRGDREEPELHAEQVQHQQGKQETRDR